jgi:hypothetical protein
MLLLLEEVDREMLVILVVLGILVLEVMVVLVDRAIQVAVAAVAAAVELAGAVGSIEVNILAMDTLDTLEAGPIQAQAVASTATEAPVVVVLQIQEMLVIQVLRAMLEILDQQEVLVLQPLPLE